MSKQTLRPGDRIALAAKFLRSTGQQCGPAGDRRGTFVSYDTLPGYARVRWDDFEQQVATGGGQYGDPEWVADCREHGQLIHAGNIARVGSARFALNDL